MPKNVLAVAESGIRTGKDIAHLQSGRLQAFLIGESLMKAASPRGMRSALFLAEADSES